MKPDEENRHLLQRLLNSCPISPGERERIPRCSGVYLFSELGEPLFVGVATGNHLRKRIRQHIVRLPARPRKATAASLAEKIAMEASRVTSRRGLYSNPDFCVEFWKLGPRIEAMELRFVAVENWTEARELGKFARSHLQPRYNGRVSVLRRDHRQRATGGW